MKSLVEAKASTIVAEVGLDPVECPGDWCVVQFCGRPVRIDVNTHVDVTGADVVAALLCVKAVGDVAVDGPATEQTDGRLRNG